MKVLVTASARFAITSDGNLWTPNASLRYNFWARYLEVFDEVHLVARAKFHSHRQRDGIWFLDQELRRCQFPIL
jgi:hypothetical protein